MWYRGSNLARISESKGRRDSNSSYVRLFGDLEIGGLISSLHAAVIRTGNELEALLRDTTPSTMISDLETVLRHIALGTRGASPSCVVVFKGIGLCKSLGYCGHADIVVFHGPERRAIVVELKDGDTFDTKKSSGERDGLIAFANWLAIKTDYQVDWSLCSFNQENRQAIVAGMKGRFSSDHVMTGRELCELLKVDYASIVEQRKADQAENLDYLAKQLLAIPNFRTLAEKYLGS
jgi:hypothetical protein